MTTSPPTPEPTRRAHRQVVATSRRRTTGGLAGAAAVVVTLVLLVVACTRQPTALDAGAPGTLGPATSLVIGGTAPATSEAPPASEETTTSAAPTAEPTTTATTVRPTTAPPARGASAGNVYAHLADPNPATDGARSLVYVPHEVSGDTWVIDPATMQVVDRFTTGPESQHVVPAYDFSTLYVVSGRGNQITPVDPKTGKPGKPIPVADPYNLYFTPDGSEAIVVAEGEQRLDFRDPKTFALHNSIQTSCSGLNHLDYSADLRYFIATCEFEGALIKVDIAQHKVVGKIPIDMGPSGKRPRNGHAQPQDVRLAADGAVFYVADLQSDGVYLIDGDSLTQVGYIRTGVGAHGLYPSRDGTKLYVVNRGTNIVGGPPHGQGSVAVLDFASRTVEATWPIPGGGSPDMGNLTADGTQLWLGGRYDGEVYVFDTVNGRFLTRIKVGANPHGLTVWPQPGRFSLGHTGNIR